MTLLGTRERRSRRRKVEREREEGKGGKGGEMNSTHVTGTLEFHPLPLSSSLLSHSPPFLPSFFSFSSSPFLISLLFFPFLCFPLSTTSLYPLDLLHDHFPLASSLSRPPRPRRCLLISTTGVLNATTLIYARRAGITAAAGTRLALFLHSA